VIDGYPLVLITFQKGNYQKKCNFDKLYNIFANAISINEMTKKEIFDSLYKQNMGPRWPKKEILMDPHY
jgi:hypothetical protein